MHGTPRIRRICAVCCRAVLAGHEARSCSCDRQITDVVAIHSRLNCVGRSIIAEGHSDVISVKPCTCFIKTMICQRIGTPLVFPWSIVIEDLGVELACCPYAPTGS